MENKTRPNPRLKKLSSALRKGYQIARENGIKVAKGELFRQKKNGEITCACALGLAQIGLYGIHKIEKNQIRMDEAGVVKHFVGSNTRSACLREKLRPLFSNSIQAQIVTANDSGMRPQKLADVLESCGL